MPVLGPGYRILENFWLLVNRYVLVIFLKFTTLLYVYMLVVEVLVFVLSCLFVFLSPFF